MDAPPTIKPMNKSNPTNFKAFDENGSQFNIKLFIENNDLIFETLVYDDKDSYDKEYKSINSHKSLTQYQKIFLAYDSLEEIKEFLESIISNSNTNSKCKIRKETNQFILSIPASLGKINELTFELKEKEKDLKDLVMQLIKDNKKKNEEIIQLKKELLQTKEELHNLKFEMDMFMVEGTYYICSAMNQNKCFDIKPTNKFYYLIINDLNKNSQTQKFKVKKYNEGNHCIMNYKGDRILDVYNGNNISGTKIIVFEDMHKNPNQCWILVKYGIYFCIKSTGCYNKVIDIPYANLNNGIELEICDYNGGNNQLWKFVKA